MAKRRGLRATRANLGIEVEYSRKLNALVREMHNSVQYWLTVEYKEQERRIMAVDARRPADALQAEINKLVGRWKKRFDDAAVGMADGFASKTKRSVDNTLGSAAKKAGMATVKFRPTKRMQDAYAGVINEQVGLIKSIPTQYLGGVQNAVMQSVQRGRDLGSLAKTLQNEYGVTKRRAALIARDQNNKATATLTRVRQMEILGDDAEAEWVHSGAGRHPRPDHVAAGARRQVYKVSQGCLIGGEYIFPGEKINCRCTSRLVFPGYTSGT